MSVRMLDDGSFVALMGAMNAAPPEGYDRREEVRAKGLASLAESARAAVKTLTGSDADVRSGLVAHLDRAMEAARKYCEENR